MKVTQPRGLIRVLLDKQAEFGDRTDAAMDLAEFDEHEAEDALLSVAIDPQQDQDLAEDCGESLGEIWSRKRKVPTQLEDLTPDAKRMAISVIRTAAPDLL